MDSIQQQAQVIAEQYLAELPEDYIGRHSAIADPDTIETFFRGVSSGLKDADVCEAAGISDRTFRRWQEIADAEPDSAYGLFVRDLKKARKTAKIAHLENIKRHSQKDWKASAWTLERTDQAQFAIQPQQHQAGLTVIVGGESQMIFVQAQAPSPQVSVDMHSLSAEQGIAKGNIKPLIGTTEAAHRDA